MKLLKTIPEAFVFSLNPRYYNKVGEENLKNTIRLALPLRKRLDLPDHLVIKYQHRTY